MLISHQSMALFIAQPGSIYIILELKHHLFIHQTAIILAINSPPNIIILADKHHYLLFRMMLTNG
jgi:hypothetical protein